MTSKTTASGVPDGDYLDLDNGGSAFVRTAGVCGDGPPILLLHGLAATGALNWAPCFRPLARRGHVIAIDHRGHGRGPRVGSRFSLADCADDAAAVLRCLARRPAIVIGYSMGGPIAQLLAHRHPDLVDGLILSATARDFSGRPADRLRFGAIAALASAAAVPLGLASLPGLPLPSFPLVPGRLRPAGWVVSELRGHEPAAVLAAAAAMGRFTSRDWVHTIDKPAAVIVHQRDRIVPARRQQKLAAAMPGAASFEVDLDHTGVRRHPERYLPVLLRAHGWLTARSASRVA